MPHIKKIALWLVSMEVRAPLNSYIPHILLIIELENDVMAILDER